MSGLSEKTITALQDTFAKYLQVEKVILYGSHAKGNYRNGSDIDLMLVGEELDLSQMFKIELELGDLMLPYIIDLALLNQIDNKEFIDHINRRGVAFYEKSKS